MTRKRGRKTLAVSVVNPAPGNLRIVQELLNTADYRRKAEGLESPRALAGWLVARDLLPAGTDLADEDLRRAIDVREGLRALTAANNGRPLDASAVERLGRALGAASFRLVFDSEGRGSFVPASRSCEDALGHIAGIVAAAQLEGTWPRLKACANDACRGVFYDLSKSQSGKWCSMRRCGNQLKSLAYRKRQPPMPPPWKSWIKDS